MKTLRWCSCLLLSGMLASALVACSHPPDEAQVRAAIDAGASAVRAADAGDLADILSDDFDGNAGLLDKRTAVNMVRVQRLRQQSVKVLLGPVSLERRGERFVATFTVTLAGGRGWMPRHPGVYRVTTGWRNEDGHWRCYTATWHLTPKRGQVHLLAQATGNFAGQKRGQVHLLAQATGNFAEKRRPISEPDPVFGFRRRARAGCIAGCRRA